MLVCRQWKSIIENRCELSIKLNTLLLSDFFRWTKSPAARRVTRLSLINRFGSFGIKEDCMGPLVGLKSISFYGLDINASIMEYIIKNNPIEEIIIRWCYLQWSDLFPLLHCRRKISLYLSNNHMAGNGFEVIIRELAYTQLEFTYKSTFSISTESRNIDRPEIYETLANTKNILGLSLDLDAVSSKHLPSTKNLTFLDIIQTHDEVLDPPELSSLTHLTKISLRRPLRFLYKFDSDNRLERNDKSMLNPILHQLTDINTLDSRYIIESEWEKLYSFDNVRSLKLFGGGLTPLDSPGHLFFTRLTRLCLEDVLILDTTLPILRNMRTLNKLRLEAVEIVETATGTKTDLSFNDLCHEVNGVLQCSMTGLTSLCVSSMRLRGSSLSALSCLESLTELSLRGCNHKEDPVHLDQIAQLQSVTHLEIPCFSTLQDAIHLSSMRHLRKLILYPYGSTCVSSQEMAYISQMSGLKHLDLSWAMLDMEGLEHVGSMKNLSSLYLHLRLVDNPTRVLSSLTNLKSLVLIGHPPYMDELVETMQSTVRNLVLNNKVIHIK